MDGAAAAGSGAASAPGPVVGPSASGLSVQLHPLVLINVSDHHTRVRAQASDGASSSGGGGAGPSGAGPRVRVLGCLLGVQAGRSVEVFNSFELKFAVGDGGAISLDEDFMATKQEQYKKVFPKLDVLGWYSTGAAPQEADMALHKKIMEINESPLYLLLDPSIKSGTKQLPVAVYESELRVLEGAPTTVFVQAAYTIETVEAERIAVDHVARLTPSGGGSSTSQLTTHLTGLHSAVKMLADRLRLLQTYVQAVQAGTAPREPAVLRAVAALVRRLPAIASAKFKEELMTEYNDTLLLTYLATMTRGTATLNELVDRFNLAFDARGGRRGRPGFV